MQSAAKLLVLFSFAASGLFIAADLKATAALRVPRSDSSAQGISRSLYVRNCARCHGADGKAQTKLGQSLGAEDLTSSDVKEMSAESIARVITRGRGDMPSFRKKLTARQIASIAQYVRTL